MAKAFSRKSFSDHAFNFMNSADHKTTVVSMKDGKKVTQNIEPVQEFKSTVFGPILRECGVSKDELEKAIANIKISKKGSESLYPMVSEMLYTYMDKEKRRFNFIPKEDFIGSLTVDDVKERVITNNRNGVATKTKTKAHKALGKKSPTPSWLKVKM